MHRNKINTKIVKNDGRLDTYKSTKILHAIQAAVLASGEKVNRDVLRKIVNSVGSELHGLPKIEVQGIHELVENNLAEAGLFKTMHTYRDYRVARSRTRLAKTDLMKSIKAIGVMTDRDNANVGNNFSAKLLRIASESNKNLILAEMTKKLSKLHENGDLYYHDLDSYNLTINCLHIPTKKMLENGFNTGYGYLRAPRRIESAADLSCILMQASQNDMFGGQSHPDFDNDLSDFLEFTRSEETALVDATFEKGSV